MGSRLDSALFFSHVDVGDALQVINQISVVRLPPAHFNIFQSVYLTRLRVRLRLKKTNRWREANHLSLVLNSSALPISHSDLLLQINHIIAERR